MTLKIRPMYDADIDNVYSIESSVHITPWSKDIIRDCVLVGYDCRVLEINKGGELLVPIIGYVISRYHNKSYHILNFCIAKSMQSQGIGKQFLQTLLQSLENNKNIDYAILEVRPSNTAALRLYSSMGFEQMEIKKDYYKDIHNKEDAIVLKKLFRS
jgi:ribosomal-protein-alanine N-acetyltransferase